MLDQNFIGVVYTTDRFMWHSELNKFSSDISLVPAVLREMYNDALDIGFAMKSVNTGKIAYFYLENGEKNADGDYTVWNFKPTHNSMYYNPRLKDVVVSIYNT